MRVEQLITDWFCVNLITPRHFTEDQSVKSIKLTFQIDSFQPGTSTETIILLLHKSLEACLFPRLDVCEMLYSEINDATKQAEAFE